MAPKAPVVELTQQQVDAIQTWNAAQESLAASKTSELENRLNCIKVLPFSEDKEEGGQTIKLNGGWKLALNKPMNYSADNDSQKVIACMTALNEVNPGIAAELIRWECVISTGAYKKLSESEKLIVAPFITIKPGTPSLELKPPPVPKA